MSDITVNLTNEVTVINLELTPIPDINLELTEEVITVAFADLGGQGPSGINGKSAYQLAIASDPPFIGTEAEWLLSLNGATNWVNINGKPTEYPPIIHTHSDLQEAINTIIHKLEVVHYDATSITTTDTYTGTVTDLQELGGNSIIINEVSGVGFDFRLNFDGVEDFTSIHLHERYYSIAGTTGGHTVPFQIYNYLQAEWEQIGAQSGVQTTLNLLEWTPDTGGASNYISTDANKRIILRAYHPAPASNNHRLEVDHVIVSHNMLTGSEAVTSHNGLSGKELPDQHPATAISYSNATAGLTATTVQAAIDEIAGGAVVSNLTTNYDKVSQTVAYVGKAVAGADPAAAVWQIKRINPTSPTAPILYAGGSEAFVNRWNNRADLEYS